MSHDINRIKEKIHVTILIGTEKPYDKIKSLFMMGITIRKCVTEGNFINMKKISIKCSRKITLKC